MWSLFVMPAAITSLVAGIATLTGSSAWMIAATLTNDMQRRRGHHPSEGSLSKRANGRPYSVGFDTSSDYRINQLLGQIALVLPEVFSSTISYRFDMTESEAEFLQTMLAPVESSLAEFRIAREHAIEKEEDVETLFKAVERLTESSLVVKEWLDRFPATRTIS